MTADITFTEQLFVTLIPAAVVVVIYYLSIGSIHPTLCRVWS